METIYYGGLLKKISLLKKFKLSRKEAIYFDYDISKCNISDLFDFTSKVNLKKLIINIKPTISRLDILELSRDFADLEKNVGSLIITSSNDLFTMVMRKYIVVRDNENVKYAFNCEFNVDSNSYFICSSARTFINENENITKIILDDREYNNKGIIYSESKINHEEVNILSKHLIKTKSL